MSTVPPIYFYGKDSGEFSAFSNFSRHGFTLDGYMWFTNEHFYQAYKFAPGGERFMAIHNAGSPGVAKRLGNDRTSEQIDPLWEVKKLDVMRRGLRAKFTQNPELSELLVSTVDAALIENSPTDSFWGCGHDSCGHNWLGRLLMELRMELKGNK